MAVPVGPKFICYTYMSPLGLQPEPINHNPLNRQTSCAVVAPNLHLSCMLFSSDRRWVHSKDVNHTTPREPETPKPCLISNAQILNITET